MTSDIFERSNSRLYRPGAMERTLASRPCRDVELAQAYEAGDVQTKSAGTRLQRTVGRLARHLFPKGRRHVPASPDRIKSLHRKRVLSGPSEIPDTHRHHYTPGEQAVLVVIVGEIMDHGYCDLCIDAIAAKAGVHRTTTQNALRKSQRMDIAHLAVELRPRRGMKNLSNIIRLVSAEWLEWLKRRIGFKKPRTTKIRVKDSFLSQSAATNAGAYENENAASISSMLMAQVRKGLGDAFGERKRGVEGLADAHRKPAGSDWNALHAETAFGAGGHRAYR